MTTVSRFKMWLTSVFAVLNLFTVLYMNRASWMVSETERFSPPPSKPHPHEVH